MTPIVRVIAHTTFLGVPCDLLPGSPEQGAGQYDQVRDKQQDQGSDMARLIECAGRTCYDSYGQGRRSSEYHKHIKETGHGSVLEHASISFYLDNISRGCCYSEDTKVLTAAGWKAFPDVTKNDKYLTKCEEDKLCYLKAVKIVRQPYKGDLLHFHSTELDLLVTPNHNMWVFDYDKRAKSERGWKFKRADTLINGRYMFDRMGEWHDDRPQIVHLPGGTYPASDGRLLQYEAKTFSDVDAFAEFVGFWAADGNLSDTTPGGSGRSIVLTQTKPAGVKRAQQLLARLGFSEVNFNEGGQAKIGCLPLWFYLRDFGDPGKKSESGHISQEIAFWPKSMLRLFIDGYMLGNGTTLPGRSIAYCGSKTMAEGLVEVCLKAGFGASVRTVAPRTRTFPGQAPSVCRESYVVNVRKGPKHLLYRRCAKSFGARVPYDGDVWCVELPRYHRLFVMRNGKAFWCGNTHELVRHRAGCAISQRSTRYVDESGSPWALHPLLEQYFDTEVVHKAPNGEATELSLKQYTNHVRTEAQQVYDKVVTALQNYMIAKGSDKTTARKQARGAARGLLGNALCTSMVWTANIRALRNVIEQRANPAADAEIRVLANKLYEASINICPEWFDDYERVECPDGIGYGLTTAFRKV